MVAGQARHRIVVGARW